MNRRGVLVLGFLLGSLSAPQADGQDAAAHRAWMDEAADLQDELREHLGGKAGDKAAAAATKIEEILAQTQAYWAAKHADDIVKIARESRTLAAAIATAARAGNIDQATDTFATMNARCNGCHDLHPEKR
jgi:ubiquinone biosynthesis protein UbiJ